MIAVTNRHLCTGDFLAQVTYLASTDIEAILLREKDLSEEEYTALATKVLDICRKYRKKCILHTYLEAAAKLGCDSIHLPLPLLLKYRGNALAVQADFSAPKAALPENPADNRLTSFSCNRLSELPENPAINSSENSLPAFSCIGASVHSVEDALAAQKAGATYLTAGHIFDTDCKKGLPGRGLAFLKDVCQATALPVYAIGGVTPENLPDVMAAGAAGGCMMSLAMKCGVS